MPVDSEPLQAFQETNDFITLFTHALEGIKGKYLILVFIAFLGLSSDVFINRILSKFENAVDMKYPTNYGIVIQGTMMVIICILLDVLINQKII